MKSSGDVITIFGKFHIRISMHRRLHWLLNLFFTHAGHGNSRQFYGPKDKSSTSFHQTINVKCSSKNRTCVWTWVSLLPTQFQNALTITQQGNFYVNGTLVNYYSHPFSQSPGGINSSRSFPGSK